MSNNQRIINLGLIVFRAHISFNKVYCFSYILSIKNAISFVSFMYVEFAFKVYKCLKRLEVVHYTIESIGIR